MPKFNFFLKEPASDKDTLILIIYRNASRGVNVRMSSRQKILPDNWDKSEQRMRKLRGLPYTNFNRTLDMMERELEDILYQLTATNQLTAERLKSDIDKLFSPVVEQSLFSYLDTLVDKTRYNQTKAFGTLKTLLSTFGTQKRRKVDFDTISEPLLKAFVEWMETSQYSANYISKMLKTLRRTMNYAHRDGLHTNPVKITDRGISEEVYNVYLTEQEIGQILKTPIPNYMEAARSLFVIGCYTGLRVGNYRAIDPDLHIDRASGYLYAIVNKNGPRVQIPIHPVVEQILSRYNGKLPVLSEAKINQQIKLICEAAKIKQNILWVRTEGGKRVEHVTPKYKMVSTHTARRSFATNAYKAKIDPYTIMQITGHKSLKTFFKYLKIQQEEAAEELKQHPFFNKKSQAPPQT